MSITKLKKRLIKKTNIPLRLLISKLLAKKLPVWERVAELLLKGNIATNISKIDKYGKKGEYIIVPGKVLSQGNITKSLVVAAFKSSRQAKQKLGKNLITIEELLKTNPKGTNTRIII